MIQESVSNELVLHDDEPEALCILLTALYDMDTYGMHSGGSYNETPMNIEQIANNILHQLKIVQVSDKYDVPALTFIAENDYYYGLDDLYHSLKGLEDPWSHKEKLAEIVEKTYEVTGARERSSVKENLLRTGVKMTGGYKSEEKKLSGLLRAVIDKHVKFGKDLLDFMLDGDKLGRESEAAHCWKCGAFPNNGNVHGRQRDRDSIDNWEWCGDFGDAAD